MLFTVARRYCGQMQDAQDVLQDSFVKILNALQTNYSEEGKLEAWMRTVVITTALNHLNSRKRKFETAVEDIPFDAGNSPEVYAQLGAEQLLKLVESLPDGYREVFNLAVIENYSHREISELMGISEGTSRSQLMRARQLLQKMIERIENYAYGNE